MIEEVECDDVRGAMRQFGRDRNCLHWKDDEGRVPMHAAAGCASAFMVELLYRLGATDLEVKDDKGRTPIMHAIRRNKSKAVVKKLIELGARIDCCSDDSQSTLLHYAARRADKWPAKFLVKRPINYDAKNANGLNAFDVAARRQHYKTAEVLCEHCNYENKDNDGRTLVDYAAEWNYPKLVDYYADCCTDNFFDATPDGSTPVHTAARHHSVAALQRLFRHSFYVDDLDNRGRTPLHRAVSYMFEDNLWQTVDVLLAHGSRALWIEDNEGRRPVDCAHNPKTAERLRQLYFSVSLLSTLLSVEKEIVATKRLE